MDSIQDYTDWATTRVDFAFSPFKHTDDHPFADVNFTLEVMSAFRTALGERAVLSQHSMNNPVNATLALIYDQMQSLGPMIEFQTHSPNGLDWEGAIQNAVGYGASAVELWTGATGFEQFPASVLQNWANALYSTSRHSKPLCAPSERCVGVWNQKRKPIRKRFVWLKREDEKGGRTNEDR